jgi:hypothetical protein
MAVSIHPVWLIDEYVKIFRRDVWFIPPGSVPQPVCRHKMKGVTRTFTYCKKLIVEFYSFILSQLPRFICLYFILSHCTD